MPVFRIDDIHDPRLGDYRSLPDPELLRRGEIFIAEGRLVVRTLLTQSPLTTRSVLLTETAYLALADVSTRNCCGCLYSSCLKAASRA